MSITSYITLSSQGFDSLGNSVDISIKQDFDELVNNEKPLDKLLFNAHVSINSQLASLINLRNNKIENIQKTMECPECGGYLKNMNWFDFDHECCIQCEDMDK